MGKKQPINHVEFRTRDSARLQHFYGTLFGWKFSDAGPDYTMIDTGNKEVGAGIMKLGAEHAQMPSGVTNYVRVKSLIDSELQITELGGKVLISKQAVQGMGHYSVYTDVDGNVMAIWQNLDKKQAKKVEKAEKHAKKAEKKAKKEHKKARVATDAG